MFDFILDVTIVMWRGELFECFVNFWPRNGDVRQKQHKCRKVFRNHCCRSQM